MISVARKNKLNLYLNQSYILCQRKREKENIRTGKKQLAWNVFLKSKMYVCAENKYLVTECDQYQPEKNSINVHHKN